MDKNKLLINYMSKMLANMDKLKENYPKAMAAEIIQMEKGFRFCATESAKWLEDVLDIIDVETSVPHYGGAIAGAIDKNTILTNSIAGVSIVTPDPIKKKKSFLQVASEAAKDMGSDLFHAAQMDLGKKEEKK